MGETENPHLHDFWICGRAHDSQTNYFYLWRRQNTTHISRENEAFKYISFLEISHVRQTVVGGGMLEKTCAGKSRWSVEQILENLQYGINIFQKTCNEILVVWDHRNVETLKPRN